MASVIFKGKALNGAFTKRILASGVTSEGMVSVQYMLKENFLYVCVESACPPCATVQMQAFIWGLCV